MSIVRYKVGVVVGRVKDDSGSRGSYNRSTPTKGLFRYSGVERGLKVTVSRLRFDPVITGYF